MTEIFQLNNSKLVEFRPKVGQLMMNAYSIDLHHSDGIWLLSSTKHQPLDQQTVCIATS